MIQNRYKLKPAQTLIYAGFVVPVSSICSPFAVPGYLVSNASCYIEGQIDRLASTEDIPWVCHLHPQGSLLCRQLGRAAV